VRFRFPVCIYCQDPIDPSSGDLVLTNTEEAKCGASPRYAHQDCHSEVAGVVVEPLVVLKSEA
jgi:hypothetical protein